MGGPAGAPRLVSEGAGSSLSSGPVLGHGRESMATSPLEARSVAQQRMPDDSLWPLLLALGVGGSFYGLVFGVGWLAVGGLVWVDRLHRRMVLDE